MPKLTCFKRNSQKARKNNKFWRTKFNNASWN